MYLPVVGSSIGSRNLPLVPNDVGEYCIGPPTGSYTETSAPQQLDVPIETPLSFTLTRCPAVPSKITSPTLFAVPIVIERLSPTAITAVAATSVPTYGAGGT